MTDLLLINASNFPGQPVYPYGLIQVRALARQRGLRAEIVDLFGVPKSAWASVLRARIDAGRPRLIGVHLRQADSVVHRDYARQQGLGYHPVDDARQLIGELRALSTAPIAVGGFGFSTHPERLFRALRPDLGIVGGADALLDSFEQAACRGDLSDVPNLVLPEGEGIRLTRKVDFPPFDGREYDEELIGELERFYSAARLCGDEPPTVAVELARGCTFNCYFCTEPKVKGTRQQLRNLDVVMDELRFLRQRGIGRIWLVCSELNLGSSALALEVAKRIAAASVPARCRRASSPSAPACCAWRRAPRCWWTRLRRPTYHTCVEAAPPLRLACCRDGAFDCAREVILQSPCPPLHTAFLENASGAERRRCDGAGAAELFARGHTISLESGGALSGPLLQLGRNLAAELGALRSPTPSITVSPRGAGTPVHFDGLEVLVVQLSGRKRWQSSRNTVVASPDFPFFPSALGPGARGGVVPDYLRELPTTGECEAPVSVTLEPGSALFLPRGFWHETLAVEDSVSVTFKLPLPTRFAVVAEAIASHLRRQPDWRVPFVAARGQAGGRRAEHEQLRQLLARLQQELGRVEVERSARTGAVLSRNRALPVTVRRSSADSSLLRAVCGSDPTGAGLEFPEQALPVIEWLERQGEFTELELVRQFRDIRVEGLRRVVQWLLDEGALECAGELQMGQGQLRLNNEMFR